MTTMTKIRIPGAVWLIAAWIALWCQIRINSEVSKSLQFHNQTIDLLSQRIDKIKKALDEY